MQFKRGTHNYTRLHMHAHCKVCTKLGATENVIFETFHIDVRLHCDTIGGGDGGDGGAVVVGAFLHIICVNPDGDGNDDDYDDVFTQTTIIMRYLFYLGPKDCVHTTILHKTLSPLTTSVGILFFFFAMSKMTF